MPKLPNLTDAEGLPDAAKGEVDRILRTGDLFRYTSEDSPVALLEAEFAEALGSKFALAVSSCSAALFLSLKALGLPRDSKVLIPAFTFAAVPSSVVHAECIPVLCECGDDYRIDLEDFEKNLLKLTRSSSAICAVTHLIWMRSWRSVTLSISP